MFINPIFQILGLKIVALKGEVNEYDKRKKNPKIELQYILFDDGETYIRLEEQDYYCYHDCSTAARILETHKNKLQYDYYMTRPDANNF